MLQRILISLCSFFFFFGPLVLHGEGNSVAAENPDAIEKGDKGDNIVRKVINYFSEANKPHPEKKFDISFIGGPHYSSESGLGIGIVGSGAYYTRRNSDGMPDASTPPSVISLKFDVCTGQLYKVGAEGYHIFGGNRWRLNYDTYFYSFKDKFWGIGYKNDINNSNESIYKSLNARIKADFVYNFASKLFVGPLFEFNYINATRVDRPELFDGQRFKTYSTGVGVTALYDSRDMPLNAYKGAYIRFDQMFNPSFLGNFYTFTRSELTLVGYTGVWKGGVLAAMYHADLTFGNTPWGLMPTFGGSDRMRGYYEGRFRDKCEMDVTLELRQHVWRRNGIVLWVGAGSVFPRFSAFKWNHVLPNAGIGYRWQFKPRVNVRLDLGFGKDDYGVNFSINEAF